MTFATFASFFNFFLNGTTDRITRSRSVHFLYPFSQASTKCQNSHCHIVSAVCDLERKGFWNSTAGLSGISPVISVSIIAPAHCHMAKILATDSRALPVANYHNSSRHSCCCLIGFCQENKSKGKKTGRFITALLLSHQNLSSSPPLLLSLLSLTLRRAELALVLVNGPQCGAM